jgi:hypothetical protein
MEIVEIYPNCLYSIRFENENLNEYQRIFKELHNIEFLIKFFSDNKYYISTNFWRKAGLRPDNPYASATRIISEATALSLYIRNITLNIAHGERPDFDDYFKFLGGKYNCLWELSPMKSYGTDRPSLIRLYAIKIDTNCYLIVDGGIKLCKTIQDSPMLKNSVFKKIDKVLEYLRANGITDNNDLN